MKLQEKVSFENALICSRLLTQPEDLANQRMRSAMMKCLRQFLTQGKALNERKQKNILHVHAREAKIFFELLVYSKHL